MKTIYADFNNIAADGCLRLNCDGTVADLNEQGIVLEEGVLLTVSDGDLIARVVVKNPSDEGVWRAEILGDVEDRWDH
ncbi:MAG: hypothetical protein WCY26_12550 [Thiohalobacteraceae bacterium]